MPGPLTVVLPAWVPCPRCEGWLCRIHGEHTHDCACPPIEDWPEGVSPYGTLGREAVEAPREGLREDHGGARLPGCLREEG